MLYQLDETLDAETVRDFPRTHPAGTGLGLWLVRGGCLGSRRACPANASPLVRPPPITIA